MLYENCTIQVPWTIYNVVLAIGEMGREMRVNRGKRGGGFPVHGRMISHYDYQDYQDKWADTERIRRILTASFTSYVSVLMAYCI